MRARPFGFSAWLSNSNGRSRGAATRVDQSRMCWTSSRFARLNAMVRSISRNPPHRVGPCLRAFEQAGDDTSLMRTALFSLGEILFRLGEQSSKMRLGRGRHDGERVLSGAMAPPPDLITGWRGTMPFLTAESQNATRPRM